MGFTELLEPDSLCAGVTESCLQQRNGDQPPLSRWEESVRSNTPADKYAQYFSLPVSSFWLVGILLQYCSEVQCIQAFGRLYWLCFGFRPTEADPCTALLRDSRILVCLAELKTYFLDAAACAVLTERSRKTQPRLGNGNGAQTRA